MNLFAVVLILGVIEGFTEFLPISSTGHLILLSKILGLPNSEFWKSFEISIQLGAILSVLVLYWKDILFSRRMLSLIMISFLPTAIIGVLFYKFIKSHLLGNAMVVLWALFLGGILIIFLEKFYFPKKLRNEKNGQRITYLQAFLIGVFQSLAMIPGVSRSAATIIGGLFLGLKRKEIVEFSFLLAIPTMAAAVGYDLFKSSAYFTTQQFFLLGVGFAVSFATAILSIKFFLSFIKRNNFIPFGIYRIILAVLVFLLIKN